MSDPKSQSSPHRRSLKSPPRLGHGQKTPNKKHGGVVALANTLLRGTPGRVISGSGSALTGSNGAPPPLLVITSQYESWMKIATENKINSTNTWNLALIDYFYDMSCFRNGDDNSVNFQKASCTLEGCVKIWTSRVDSVATETGKLLSGLAEDGRAAENDEEDAESGDDEGQEGRSKKRKAARQASTLADSFSKIKVKAFDLEFTVDPLFKKTSADFDEGGAGGILMNHLGCDGNMKVVFDAGDAKLENDEDDEEDVETEAELRMDLSKLRVKHLPNLDSFERYVLCPSLASFRFSAEGTIDLGITDPIDDEEPIRPSAGIEGGYDGGEEVDVFAGVDFGGGGDDDEGGGAVDFFDDGPGDEGGVESGQVEDFDPRRPQGERDLVVSMDDKGDQSFDFFDASSTKNWAGPDHWKMRRPMNLRKDESVITAKQRKEKVAFSIDFSLPPLISQKELFAAGLATSINAPRKSTAAPTAKSRRSSRPQAAKEDTHVLPDDFHFSSQLLLRLFLKPKTALRMRRRTPVDGEPDAAFWAPTAGMVEDDEDMGGMGEFHFDDDGSGEHAPFETQFFHDDEDIPDFEEEEDGAEEDLLAATQGQLKRVRPEEVNYAKRAKRVDVKKLKDSIWKELEEVTIAVKEFPSAAAYAREEDSKSEALVPVISGLRKLYPKDKMEEISTSFCFICLLHLANEKGLRIQTPESEEGGVDDGLSERASVGGLDRLRVFRELVV